MSHVILLAPEISAGQVRFVRGLKRVGARVTGIGQTPPEQLEPEVRHLLDAYEPVRSLHDVDALEAVVRAVQARGPWVHHLEATTAEHTWVAARVRARTSIPGMSEAQALLCHDRYRMKQFLRERGVPCAHVEDVGSSAAAAAFVERVGFPVVLKPRDAADLSRTWRIDDPDDLARALAESGVADGVEGFVIEEYVPGHEGFYDALVHDGEVVFEGASHHYPPVLEALRARWISPQIVHTNRIDQDGYDPLKALARRVIGELGLRTTVVHLRWLSGPRGLWFHQITAAPAPFDLWEMVCEAAELDLHAGWAQALTGTRPELRPSRRFAAGLINLRPSQDGTIAGYHGIEAMQRRYGELIFRMHLPPPGTPTQPIADGYRANAWVCLKHPDYDALREILDDVGRTVKVIAR